MSDFMNDIKIRSLTRVTDVHHKSVNHTSDQGSQSDFSDVLAQKIRANSQIEFSKHAMKRVAEREVNLTEAQIARLNHGVTLAQRKGLTDTLILVDKVAFVVNVPHNKVITTVSDQGLKEAVFTQIDGAVIV